jgi:hypothetical protein
VGIIMLRKLALILKCRKVHKELGDRNPRKKMSEQEVVEFVPD